MDEHFLSSQNPFKSMHQEKYNLSWTSYSDHLKSMMKELMMSEDFSDVTLVTEDRKHIKANIHILSSCSPFFQEIWKKEKHLGPKVMYLRGIQYSEMESIMQFIYLGEATFYEEHMEELLAVARSLEIKELSNSAPEIVDFDDDPIEPVIETKMMNDVTDHITKQEPKYEREGVVSPNGKHEGVKYPCDKCDYLANRQYQLTRHIQSMHEGVKYSCDKCDFQANRQENLTRHIQSIHEGIKYTCDWCDYQAKRQDKLTKHINSKHGGVRYACDWCDHQAKRQDHLTKHIQYKHQGVKHSCDQCDYQSLHKSHLARHIAVKH